MAERATEEQLLYAKLLNAGMLVGLVALLATFLLYGFGIMSPQVPMEEIKQYQRVSVQEYLEKSGVETGWAWIGKLHYGDMLNFLPIAFLSAITIFCYLAIIPGLLRKKDTTYAVLCVLEVLVLVLAASGILKSGGH